MTLALGILAILCAVYFAVIAVYSGITTSFSFVWLFFSAVLFLMAAGHEIYVRYPKKLPMALVVPAVTTCVAGAAVFLVVEALVFAGAAESSQPGLDYLIVLGAKVRDGRVGGSLKKRLDKAIEYVQQNPETVLVLSGGRGEGEPVSEARAMHDYLRFNGVREEQMILETFSTSTVENIAYSRVRIEEDQEERVRRLADRYLMRPEDIRKIEPDKPLEIGVLTSNYHVFRAKQIAKKWGIPDIHGIATASDPVLFVHYCVRECAAILKDRLMGNM